MKYYPQIIVGETPINAIEAEWRDLFNQAESPNPFLSAEWVFAWLKHSGPQVFPVTLIVRDENDQLGAVWPFFEYPAIGGRGLWAGLSDRGYILNPLFIRNEPELIQTTLRGIERFLAKYRFVWVPLFTDTFVNDQLRPSLAEFPNLSLIQKRIPAPYIDLSKQKSFDNYLENTLGTKTRKSLRYDAKQLEKLATVEYAVYRTEDDYHRIETEMRTIEKVSWKNRDKKALLSDRRTEAFFHELLPQLMACGQAEISALRLNQMAIAFEIAIRRDGYYGFYHIAYLPDFHKHSPGKQLMLHNIERAMNEGCAEFDFMQGAHDYKLKFKTGSREMMDAFMCQRSFTGWLNYGLAKLSSFFRRLRG